VAIEIVLQATDEKLVSSCPSGLNKPQPREHALFARKALPFWTQGLLDQGFANVVGEMRRYYSCETVSSL
jgi:hypothetical protein